LWIDLCNQIVKSIPPKNLEFANAVFSKTIAFSRMKMSSNMDYKKITTAEELFSAAEKLFELEKSPGQLHYFMVDLKQKFLFTYHIHLKIPENLTNPDYKFPGKSIFIHCIAEAIARRELLGKGYSEINYESIAKELGLPTEFDALEKYAIANKITIDPMHTTANNVLSHVVLHKKALQILDILNDRTKNDERQKLLAKLNGDDILEALERFVKYLGISSHMIRESTDVFSFIPQNSLTEVVELEGLYKNLGENSARTNENFRKKAQEMGIVVGKNIDIKGKKEEEIDKLYSEDNEKLLKLMKDQIAENLINACPQISSLIKPTAYTSKFEHAQLVENLLTNANYSSYIFFSPFELNSQISYIPAALLSFLKNKTSELNLVFQDPPNLVKPKTDAFDFAS